jgi:ATP-binding cassette, subfamily B, bacterial PglK
VTADGQNSSASIFTTLYRCIAMLPATMRWRWAALIPISLTTGILEAGAAAAVFALVKVIGEPAQITHLPIAARIAALLSASTPRAQLLTFLGLLAIYYVFKNLLVIGSQYLRHHVAGESRAALKSTTFKAYLTAPYAFHLGRNSADLISNINFCVEMLCDQAMEAAVAAGSELLTAGAITVVLLVAAPEVTLAAGVLLALLLALMLRLTRRMARHFGTQRRQVELTSLQTLQEALAAIKEVKALGREDFFGRSFDEQQQRVVEVGYLGKTLENITPQITETVFVCGALAVVALVTGIGQAGGQGASLLALFAYAAFRIVPAANRIGWRVNQIRSAGPAVTSLYDDYCLFAEMALQQTPDYQMPRFREHIALEHLSHIFENAGRPAVQDVSLTVRCGESIGIVGPTGAGKTTLVDLMIGLLQPTSGRILIDGTELSGRTSSWTRRVGYVPQAIFLIDDTLRRNIALGIDEGEIDEPRVRIALRMAQLEHFVASLPEGLDTLVGERGVRLSGGERQRVAIARALYHDPDLLVFDEATSALDLATEAAVAQAIEALHGQKTLIVVAHRLSSVRGCDRLIFLSAGRVRACGSYEDLLRDDPEFERMVRLQDRRNTAAPA